MLAGTRVPPGKVEQRERALRSDMKKLGPAVRLRTGLGEWQELAERHQSPCFFKGGNVLEPLIQL